MSATGWQMDTKPMMTVHIPRQREPKPHIYMNEHGYWSVCLVTAMPNYTTEHWPDYLKTLQWLSRLNGCR